VRARFRLCSSIFLIKVCLYRWVAELGFGACEMVRRIGMGISGIS
jgi:hypothetical protein